MNLQNIKNEIKEILGDYFVAVEMGTWNDNVHFIYVRANYCSLNQAKEIARICGVEDPVFCADLNYHLKILIDLNTMT